MIDVLHEMKMKKQGHQCQMWAPMITRATAGVPPGAVYTIMRDRHPNTPVTLKQVKNGKEKGTAEQLDTLINQTRATPTEAFAKRHSSEEEKCTLKWYCSLGELISSTSNRYRIPIDRPEVFKLYGEDGVKSILLSMMTEWPDVWQTRAETCSKMADEEISKDSMDWALVQMYRWKQSNFRGKCPTFSWKRPPKKFWEIVNTKQPKSNKKVMKSYFSIKLHPCPLCKEWEQELEIFKELKRAYEGEDEEDKEAKAEKKNV